MISLTADLRSYLDQLETGELIRVTESVSPLEYECSVFMRKLADLGKSPAVLFENPRNAYGGPSSSRLLLNAESTSSKIATALNMPPGTSRQSLVLECLRRDTAGSFPPVPTAVVDAPVKAVVREGSDADLLELPLMRHYEQDSGPYLFMVSILRSLDGAYHSSFNRVEVKEAGVASFMLPPHPSELFARYASLEIDCPVVLVLGHHPAFNLGALRQGSTEDAYVRTSRYLGEPLRVVPSQSWGEDFMVPADAEILVEGALVAGRGSGDGPVGEAAGYVDSARSSGVLQFEVSAVTCRTSPIMQSILTPQGEKPWLELPREVEYLRIARDAYSGVVALCKAGRFAYFNVFVSMNKTHDSNTESVASALLGLPQVKNVFIFDADIDVYSPSDILWALATRVQPHRQVSILPARMPASGLDPSVCVDDRGMTSGLIVDATWPLSMPIPEVSRYPERAWERLNLTRFISAEDLALIPEDRSSYWG